MIFLTKDRTVVYLEEVKRK